MQAWVPISTSAKGRLARRALEEFGREGFERINLAQLAAGAGVTTGSVYHHFGSKLGIYAFVRAEAEQRLLDRMEGAAEVVGDDPSGAVRAALLVGFDFAVRQGFLRLLGEPHPDQPADPVPALLARVANAQRSPVGRVLAAAWRSALLLVADGTPPPDARAALAALTVDASTLRAR